MKEDGSGKQRDDAARGLKLNASRMKRVLRGRLKGILFIAASLSLQACTAFAAHTQAWKRAKSDSLMIVGYMKLATPQTDDVMIEKHRKRWFLVARDERGGRRVLADLTNASKPAPISQTSETSDSADAAVSFSAPAARASLIDNFGETLELEIEKGELLLFAASPQLHTQIGSFILRDENLSSSAEDGSRVLVDARGYVYFIVPGDDLYILRVSYDSDRGAHAG